MKKNLHENIKSLLGSEDEVIKKNITVILDEEKLNKVDKIAKIFSGINRTKKFSRNSIIEMAIDEFIAEAENILLNEYGRDINDEEIKEENRTEYKAKDDYDLVTFPAHNEGFAEMFLEKSVWYSVRMSATKIDKIKYVALYRGAPVSAITHYGKIKEIKFYKDTKKYIIYLEGEPIKINNAVRLGDSNANSMRAPRYTKLEKLLAAKEVKDLF